MRRKLRRTLDGPGHASFALPPRAIALALLLKYLGLVAYGIHAVWVGVPSFTAVGGVAFATGWAAAIMVLAALSAAGVIRSWKTNKFRLEKIATASLIICFLAYSVVLAVRGLLLQEWSAITLAWLPINLCVFPAMRRFWIAGR